MEVKAFGLFRELKHGDPSGASIHDHLRDEPHPDAERIQRYLSSGVPLLGGSGVTRDVLSPTKEVVGPMMLVTDGEWIWPADLAFYVRKYNVALPEELVEAMRRKNWKIPDLTEEEILRISRTWMSQHSAG
jgi:hypothetical protein